MRGDVERRFQGRFEVPALEFIFVSRRIFRVQSFALGYADNRGRGCAVVVEVESHVNLHFGLDLPFRVQSYVLIDNRSVGKRRRREGGVGKPAQKVIVGALRNFGSVSRPRSYCFLLGGGRSVIIVVQRHRDLSSNFGSPFGVKRNVRLNDRVAPRLSQSLVFEPAAEVVIGAGRRKIHLCALIIGFYFRLVVVTQFESNVIGLLASAQCEHKHRNDQEQ